MGSLRIDSHVHFACADRLEELMRYRSELSIDRLGIVSLPSDRRVNFNPEVLYAKLMLPEVCYGFASFDYSTLWANGRDELDLAAQVKSAYRVGFDGIKMWEGKPTFQQLIGLRLDDPIFTPAFETAAELRMPIVLHVADPPEFWSPTSGGEARLGWQRAGAGTPPRPPAPGAHSGENALPTFESLQEQTETILRRHRGCTFIFPHLLFRTGNLQAFSDFMEANPNACLDLSPGLYYYGDLHRHRPAAREFLVHFADRILFGTDSMWFCSTFPELPQWRLAENLKRARFLIAFLETEEELENPFAMTRESLPRVRGLGLPQETLDWLSHGTFTRLFEARPRRLDRPAARRYLSDFRGSLSLLESLSARMDDAGSGSFDPQFFREVAAVENEFAGQKGGNL